MLRPTLLTLATGTVLAAALAAVPARADSPPLSDEQFARLHAQVKRQPREARYLDIDWHPSLWEARQKAAREGKPLFLWAGSEGAPAAGC